MDSLSLTVEKKEARTNPQMASVTKASQGTYSPHKHVQRVRGRSTMLKAEHCHTNDTHGLEIAINIEYDCHCMTRLPSKCCIWCQRQPVPKAVGLTSVGGPTKRGKCGEPTDQRKATSCERTPNSALVSEGTLYIRVSGRRKDE